MEVVLDCLECGCPRQVDPLGPLTRCPNCGAGFVKIPKESHEDQDHHR